MTGPEETHAHRARPPVLDLAALLAAPLCQDCWPIVLQCKGAVYYVSFDSRYELLTSCQCILSLVLVAQSCVCCTQASKEAWWQRRCQRSFSMQSKAMS